MVLMVRRMTTINVLSWFYCDTAQMSHKCFVICMLWGHLSSQLLPTWVKAFYTFKRRRWKCNIQSNTSLLLSYNRRLGRYRYIGPYGQYRQNRYIGIASIALVAIYRLICHLFGQYIGSCEPILVIAYWYIGKNLTDMPTLLPNIDLFCHT